MLIVDINAKIIVAGYSTEYFLLLNGREKPTQAKTVTDSALKALKTITDNMTLRNKLGNSWARGLSNSPARISLDRRGWATRIGKPFIASMRCCSFHSSSIS